MRPTTPPHLLHSPGPSSPNRARAEDLNDRVISSDWRESIDWAGLRTPAPTEVHTPQQKAGALGGAQRLRPMSGANGGLAMRLHGTLPEYFPPGSVPYLMELMFHPQLVEVHRLCLGAPRPSRFLRPGPIFTSTLPCSHSTSNFVHARRMGSETVGAQVASGCTTSWSSC